MEIVCDTNIWYELGQNKPTKKFLDSNSLIGTYNAIDELSRTPNIINHCNYVRNAIQAMMTYPKLVIYEPPLLYLKRLNNPKFNYNPISELKNILQFTKLLANGYTIDEKKEDDFKAHCEDRSDKLQLAADFFNSEAAKIKPNIKNREKHIKENSIPLNRNFISFFVETATKDSGLSEDFNWENIELFESVLKVLFNELEVGAITLTANDWYDLLNMIYVSKDRKYWTRDKKWINLIKKAGMEKYLFTAE